MNINILILQSTKFSIFTPTPTLLHAVRVTPMSDHVFAVLRTLPWVHLTQSKSQSSHHDPSRRLHTMSVTSLPSSPPLFPAHSSPATLLFLQSSFPSLPWGLCTAILFAWNSLPPGKSLPHSSPPLALCLLDIPWEMSLLHRSLSSSLLLFSPKHRIAYNNQRVWYLFPH